MGKTAVYRRWKSKLHLVLDLVAAVAAQGMPAPATGSLYGDVRAVLELAAYALRHPVASQVIPDLLVEAARNPEISDAIKAALLDQQQGWRPWSYARRWPAGNSPRAATRTGHWT